jgi:hypothetical protein
MRARLELALEQAQTSDPTEPVTPGELAGTIAADVRALETADADDATLTLASRWAREHLHEARLARVLGCRAADSAKSGPLLLACADDLAAAGAWPEALQRLSLAFGTQDAGTQCEVVRRIDHSSQTPGADLSSFPADAVRACRIEVAKAALTAGALPAEAPKEEAVVAGLQVGARLGMGPTGATIVMDVGWSNSRVGFALSPTFDFNSINVEGGTATYGNLGLSANATIYFSERRAHGLTGFVRPSVTVAETWLTTTTLTSVQGGASLGAEYLLNRNLGFTAELGVHAGTARVPDATTLRGEVGVLLSGSLGILLHQ